MLNAKKGLSSCQAARDIEVSQTSTWSMMHRIRNAMKDDNSLLSGIVEMDETYVGGKPRKKTEALPSKAGRFSHQNGFQCSS